MKQLFYIILPLLGLTSACNTEVFEEKMVRFDQTFVPVWYYVQLGNFSQATASFLKLEEEWKQFKRTSSPLSRNTKNWKNSVGEVEEWLKETNCALGERNADLALNQLDHARYEMIDWRWKLGIDYYLDYVWDLEASIDVAHSAAIDPLLDLLEWNEFQQVNADLYASWEELDGQTLDVDLFGFSEWDIQQFEKSKAELESLLLAYLKESECMDTCQYSEAVGSLHYAFLSFLKPFGDFDAIVYL